MDKKTHLCSTASSSSQPGSLSVPGPLSPGGRGNACSPGPSGSRMLRPLSRGGHPSAGEGPWAAGVLGPGRATRGALTRRGPEPHPPSREACSGPVRPAGATPCGVGCRPSAACGVGVRQGQEAQAAARTRQACRTGCRGAPPGPGLGLGTGGWGGGELPAVPSPQRAHLALLRAPAARPAALEASAQAPTGTAWPGELGWPEAATCSAAWAVRTGSTWLMAAKTKRRKTFCVETFSTMKQAESQVGSASAAERLSVTCSSRSSVFSREDDHMLLISTPESQGRPQ